MAILCALTPLMNGKWSNENIALAAYELPGEFLRDPADRILVATAVVHNFTLMTADNRILEYPHLLSHDARI